VSATLKESGAAGALIYQTATPLRHAAARILRREIENLIVDSLDCVPDPPPAPSFVAAITIDLRSGSV